MSREQMKARVEAERGCSSDPCGSKVCQAQRDRAKMGKYCENGTGIYWTGEHCAECKTEWPRATTAAIREALGEDA